ncbi:succinate dehydrogenase assembly factor 2, mitochondrial [Wyeomyia smithii]|uniref:succinate dehydrogenase assembly factor 2, mitochondrial n=1 Tax=Wyeomyia smithii TaxID=174621 RepID=UPI002467F774|nr:succinate dehydrogenase assembly factor 2, mitochondrial [Wyeomyia smithii]
MFIHLSRYFNIRYASAFRSISSGRFLLVPPRDGDGNPPMIDLEDKSIPIPIYKEKQNEPLQLQKSRLLYQSRKRGMLENGLLLSTFAAKYLDSMNAQQTKLYDSLINTPSNDWDIFYWATGVKPTPPEYDNEIMTMLKDHVKNSNREQRYHQPNLN